MKPFSDLRHFTPFPLAYCRSALSLRSALYLFYGERLHRCLCRAGDVASAGVMAFERPLAAEWRNSKIREVENGGAFHFVQAYSRGPTVLRKSLDLSNFPADMTYSLSNLAFA